MTFRSFAAIVGIAFSALIFNVSVSAQGIIIPIICDLRPCRPRPMPQPLPNALPVKSIQLDTKINGQVATTHVEQVFRNDTQFTLEGTYFFPIPETASIVEFAIWENGKKLVSRHVGPSTIFSSFVSAGHFPIALETDEMIEPNGIEAL